MAKKNSRTSSVLRNTNTSSVSIILLVLGLVFFLLFNYFTTYDTMTMMLGDSNPVILLVIGITIIDLAGFTRVITKEDELSRESLIVWISFFVWIVAALVDLVFTAWWAFLMMQNAPIPANTPVAWVKAFPWAVALIEFCIRIPLVLVLGKILDKKLNANRSFSPAVKSSPRTVTKQQPRAVPAQFSSKLHTGSMPRSSGD